MEDAKQKITTNKPKNISINQNQTTISTPEHQTNNQTDTVTKVYIRLDEPKVTVSFRCNRELWFAFKKQIRAQGLSICHVLEPMIFGWLNGYVNICSTIKPLKIENFIVERAVKRVRRYAVEVEGGVDGGERRFYCALRNCHVPVGSLPTSDCFSCPNGSCRGFVLGKG